MESTSKKRKASTIDEDASALSSPKPTRKIRKTPSRVKKSSSVAPQTSSPAVEGSSDTQVPEPSSTTGIDRPLSKVIIDLQEESLDSPSSSSVLAPDSTVGGHPSDSEPAKTPAKTAAGKRAAKKRASPTTRKTTGKTKAKKAAVPDLPPPAIPVPVTRMVQAKVDQMYAFKEFDMKYGSNVLERDGENTSVIHIPELDLGGVLINMLTRWELHTLTDLENAWRDIEEAIVEDYQKALAPDRDPVPCVALDLEKARATKFEQRIQEKILNHGLEGVSLLELEMEMLARQNAASAGFTECGYDPGMSAADKMAELTR